MLSNSVSMLLFFGGGVCRGAIATEHSLGHLTKARRTLLLLSPLKGKKSGSGSKGARVLRTHLLRLPVGRPRVSEHTRCCPDYGYGPTAAHSR